jgi:hypothetical protein
MILPPAFSDGLSPFVKIDLSLLAYPLKSVKRSQAFFESRLCGFFAAIPPYGSPISFPLETQSFQCGSRFCHINSIVGQPLRLPNFAHPQRQLHCPEKRQSTTALQNASAKPSHGMAATFWSAALLRRLPLGLPILSRPDQFAQRRH